MIPAILEFPGNHVFHHSLQVCAHEQGDCRFLFRLASG